LSSRSRESSVEAFETVVKLVLVAPQWLRSTRSAADTGGPLGAYRTVDRTQAKARWLAGVPEHKHEELLSAAWFDAWADATFAVAQANPGDADRHQSA